MTNSRLTTTVVTATFMLLSCQARAAESVFHDSESPIFQSVAKTENPETSDSFEDFSAEETQDLSLAPSIGITGDAFVSQLPETNWQAGVDLTVFRTKFGSVNFSKGSDGEYVGTPRFYLGYENKKGFGVRGRLWGYENVGVNPAIAHHQYTGGLITFRGYDFRSASPVSTVDPNASTEVNLKAGSIDLDFYKRFSSGQTDLIAGAGIRSAGVIFESAEFNQKDTLSTVGISLFSELQHVLHQSKFGEVSFVANGRLSWLSGEHDYQNSSTNYTLDEGLTTSEAGLGLQWKRDFGWSVMTLRAQYETQLWNGDGPSDITFNGGVIRAGFSW